MNLLRKIEDLHNRASDTRFVWFPFLWLKPNPDQPIGFARLIQMTVCFGPYLGIFYIARQWAFGEPMTLKSVGIAILYSTAFIFLWFSAVTRPLWNRRARRRQ